MKSKDILLTKIKGLYIMAHRQQLERKLVNEYIAENLSDKHTQTSVWLGPLPPGKEANMFMVVGRWADLIVFEPNLITIIEAKLEPKGDAIGQLKLYEQMFGQSPRFSQYKDRPIKLQLLTTRVDTPVADLARTQNIEYKVFRPDWIPFWEKRRFRL